MTTAESRTARLRELYDLHSEGNAAWGGTYDGDLHGAFHRLRETGPVHEGTVSELIGRPMASRANDRPSFSCFSWETVDTALRDHVTFSSAVHSAQMPFGPNILQMVGEEHRRLRAVSQPAFTRRAAQWWMDRWIVPSVDELLSGIEGKGRADLNLEFCALLPLLITTRSFGIPDDDAVGYREMVEGMIRPGPVEDRHEAAAEVAAHLAPIIARHHAHPEDDVLSVFTEGTLVDADGVTRPLTGDEILGYCRLLLAAGTGTTWRQLGITLYALLADPEQLEAVEQDRSLLRAAVEESVRWEVTDPTFYRIVTRDVELGGVTVPEGAVLEMCLSAANRDPSRWTDPDTYDLRRPMLPHSGFAGGPHVCLGLHVARAELTAALDGVLDRLPNLRIDDQADEPVRIVGQEHRGVNSLPVAFG
jgi:cytochrome P450